MFEFFILMFGSLFLAGGVALDKMDQIAAKQRQKEASARYEEQRRLAKEQSKKDEEIVRSLVLNDRSATFYRICHNKEDTLNQVNAVLHTIAGFEDYTETNVTSQLSVCTMYALMGKLRYETIHFYSYYGKFTIDQELSYLRWFRQTIYEHSGVWLPIYITDSPHHYEFIKVLPGYKLIDEIK